MTRFILHRSLAFSMIFMLAVSAPAVAQQSLRFQTLLEEAGLILETPQELAPTDVPETPLYSFERAYRHKKKPLEIRYAVRPIARIAIDYNDPHSSAPKPDHVFPMVFQALIGQLSKRGHMPTREYGLQAAKKLFNADWAAAAIFDADPELNTNYSTALLIAIHKSHKGDAYMLFLFDDANEVKPEIDGLLTRLRFSGKISNP